MIRLGLAERGQRRRIAAIAAFLALVVLVAGVWSTGDGSPGARPQTVAATATVPASATAPTSGASTQSPTRLSGVTPAGAAQPVALRLSAGRASTPAAPVAVVDGHPLSKDQIAAIVGRLPAWTGTDVLAQPFRWPTQTTVAPQAGRAVTLPFPAPGAPEKPTAPPAGPLHVLRMQPQGAVAVAPFLSITFDRPMVPVATAGQLTATHVPATISPKVAGTWQWIGTSTLRFAADSDQVDRLPMATDFTVTVPVGTRAADGETLGKATSFRFSTPPPSVQNFEPTGAAMPVDPVFLAVFDQRVNPQSVLPFVALSAGGTSWPVRLATAAEVAADPHASQTAGTAPHGRVLAFRPVRPLPVDRPVTVTFRAGTPSAEGLRTTGTPAKFTGHTYAALKLTRTDCDGGGRCQPSSPLTLTFNNALDAHSFDPTTIRISPQVPGGATVQVADTAIIVQGATQADTVYTLTVPAGLRDVFGQKLAAPAVATIRIAKATARLDPFPQPITTLDPMVAAPSVTVNTVNRTEFRERVFTVAPSDWPDFQRFYVKTAQNDYQSGATLDVPHWPVRLDRIVAVTGPKDALVSTKLDLSKVMSGPGATGDVVVLIEPTDRESFGDNIWQNAPTMTWAQSTTLGLDALSDATRLRAWVTDLRNGSPIPGVTVGMVGSDGRVDLQQAAATDADGIASVALPVAGAGALLATQGTQRALLPSAMWNNSWTRSPTPDQLLWFVDDDRGTYRPGETVSIKGWVRRQGSDVQATLTSPPRQSTVSYTARDANGLDIGHGTTLTSTLGGFDLTVKIPAGANLGSAWIELSIAGVAHVDKNASTYNQPFEIADFRTPDFEVNTHGESTAPYVVGNDLTVAADATYYAGGPLGDAPVDWQVRTAPAIYAPPGWNAFTFGIWTPWWETGDAGFGAKGAGRAISGPCCGPTVPDPATVAKFSGTTDSRGSNYLQVQVGDLAGDQAGLPVTVTAQATVTDVNRQAIAGSTDLLVHPADYYVGLSGDDTFVTQGKDLVVQAIATGIDGKAAPGRVIKIRSSKLTTTWVNGASVDSESDTQTCQVTSGAGPVPCTFHPTVAGTYRITATITDAKGRTSRTQLTRWVAGPDGAVDSSVQLQQLTLVPDKKEYQPGESARLLVQSPIRSGSGLLTVVHNGIVSTSKFAVADGSAVVSVPVTDAEVPGVTVSIEVVGTAPRTATTTGAAATPTALRPAYATGQIDLTVSTSTRTLTVTATPRQTTVAPGGSTAVDVTVTDPHGQPVAGSEFELVVADEAVLALGGYQLPDPIQAFYPDLPVRLDTVYGRSTVMLANPPPEQASSRSAPAAGSSAASAAAASAPAAAATAPTPGNYGLADSSTGSNGVKQVAHGSAAGGAINDRKNFDALALFVPAATTDSRGHATITVPLPDNLTRYRVMLVAVAGNTQFGSADATITAALPVTVRPSAPRFLNFGDKLELPVLVQNQTAAPLTTDVLIQAANLLISGPAGQQVTVPAHGRVEVRFPVSAQQAGTAKLRVAAVSGTAVDAATVELPVYTPTTTETFASYGVIDGGDTLRQPVTKPTGVVAQFGGLQISTSSTALQQLTDAVGYLADYDYDSSDALAGQIIAIGSLGDVLKAFAAPGLPSAEALKALVTVDVGKLRALQNDDGGFPYWQHGDKSDPFNSIQSTQALLVASRRGFTVPAGNVARAVNYLGQIDAHIPPSASQATRDTLRSYALNVLMQAGHRDSAAAEALVRQRGAALPMDAVAWLLPVVADAPTRAALERIVGNAAVDDAGSVTFTNKVTDDAWTTLQSDRRTDGLILDALLSVQPGSDLIPKIVSGLMAAQTSGRWENVQENAFILLAIRHYYDTFETSSPDFVARIWLGDRFAGEHAYQGHTTERATVSIPTTQLLAAGTDDVTLNNDGTGRLYYRIGLQSAPADLLLAPLDHGFVVTRTYEGADHPGDVTRDAAGTWHIKAGARVRVRLELVSRSAQTHVALIDPLPAGLQILNPELATTPKDLDPKAAAALPQKYYATWYDHQNLRDDRAEAFAGQLQGGVYEYSYLATATTVGTFVAPPTRAEQIYAPETFGRAGSDRVVVGG